MDATGGAVLGMVRNGKERQCFRVEALRTRFASPLPAEMHQRGVDCYPVKPRGQPGFAAKRADFSKKDQKNLLRNVLGVGGVFQHSQANAIDVTAVRPIEVFKSRWVAILGAPNEFLRIRTKRWRFRGGGCRGDFVFDVC